MNTENSPALKIYHPNRRGTGCAMKLTMTPATTGEDGSINLALASQKKWEEYVTFPRFDWENAVEVKLSFDDICLMLQVFRGECENINDGKGLFHVNAHLHTVNLSHIIEPLCGYYLVVKQKDNVTEETRTWKIFLSTSESLGICEAFASSLGRICFGD